MLPYRYAENAERWSGSEERRRGERSRENMREVSLG